jgi:glycosyltransferase involved in cell wall biosynthesis
LSRLVIDITTLARWRGPPVGIPRCQLRYAQAAHALYPDTVFTIFDPRMRAFRVLSQDWADKVLAGQAKVDMTLMPDPTGLSPRSIDRVPAWLRRPYAWTTRFRRTLAAAIEQGRIAADSPAWLRKLADRATPRKYRPLLVAPDGARVDWPTLDRMAGTPLRLQPGDVTVAMQYDWLDTGLGVATALRDAARARHVVLCHDIIPLQFPQWYSADEVRVFRAYWAHAFAHADRLVFTSRRTAEDAAAWCAGEGIAMAGHCVVPMGADAVGAAPASVPLPAGLAADRFALYVSTVEPRKNHRMLVEAWRHLVRDRTVAATGFRLVFVGRHGWMTDEVLAEIGADPALAASIQHLSGVEDDLLARLYADAAFCLYPAKFEGFGLPPVEALAHGKALIASSAGPIPEIVGGFAVCLDPDDRPAWETRMRAWMTGSPERDAVAARAKESYRALTWDEAARRFLAAVLE